MRYLVAIVFSGLTAAALAGAPPQECTACKPVEAKAEASCAGEASCSGRTTFAQRRAERVAGRSAARCAAREARAEARSCAGAKSCSGS